MRIGRVLLIGMFVLVGSCVLATFLFAFEGTRFVNEQAVMENRLAIPPLLEPSTENSEKVFALTAKEGEAEFIQGKRTETLGFNGDYLGPTIRVHTGDKVRMRVTNDLGETTTVHWHGMHLPAVMDGGPHQPVVPGETWTPNWTDTNEASTLWYHPHQMGKTGEHVYRGLAGLFIIDDDNSDALDIPKEYGVDDLPLVVQDRTFDDSGQFVYDHDSNAIFPKAAGMLGDTILVNGTRAPYVEVPRKLIRLRLVNASNGRRYDFGFSDNRSFYQIASDGGLLEAPVERTRVLLASGERAEILVDLSDAQGNLTLMSYAVVEQNVVKKLTKKIFGENDENQQFKILELRPGPGRADSAAQEIPKTLNTVERLDAASAVTTRRFSLQDARTINNKEMDHARVDEIVKKGDIEIWEVQNQMAIYHSFHVHGVQFLVLDRDGAKPPAHEQGWKDTVIIDSDETVRLIMQFNAYSDSTLPYMFHCHILEHEDEGMMGQFVVVDSLSDDVQVKSPLTDAPEQQHPH